MSLSYVVSELARNPLGLRLAFVSLRGRSVRCSLLAVVCVVVVFVLVLVVLVVLLLLGLFFDQLIVSLLL